MGIEKYYLIEGDGRYFWASIIGYLNAWVSLSKVFQCKSKSVTSFLAGLCKVSVNEVIK